VAANRFRNIIGGLRSDRESVEMIRPSECVPVPPVSGGADGSAGSGVELGSSNTNTTTNNNSNQA